MKRFFKNYKQKKSNKMLINTTYNRVLYEERKSTFSEIEFCSPSKSFQKNPTINIYEQSCDNIEIDF